MATGDAQMNIYLNTIEEGIYGKDIKDAIHDGMEKSYNDATTWGNNSINTANRAISTSNNALNVANGMSNQISAVQYALTEVDSKYDETNNRVDNIIAHNNDTEGNTELIDIRATYNAYTAGSAGSAVRLQARQLNGRIDNLIQSIPTNPVVTNQGVSITKTVLWTNPSPSNVFLGQTINFTSSLTGNEVEIVIKWKRMNFDDGNSYMTTTASATAITNGTYDMYNGTIAWIPDGYMESSSRIIRYTRGFQLYSTHMVIFDAYQSQVRNMTISGNDLTIDTAPTVYTMMNNWIVPLEIYAVSHTLSGTINVPKDAELIDARTAVDGTIYNTVGEAIRGQIAQYSAAGVITALDTSY